MVVPMNFDNILDVWVHDCLLLVFPSFPIIFAYGAALVAVILVIILKYQKSRYGRIWVDDDEFPKSLCIAAVVGMCIFLFPAAVGLVIAALIIWLFMLIVNKAFED